MQDELLGSVKADKKNKHRRTNCLARILKAWDVQQQDRFIPFYYPCCSETFFRKVITVVKMALTTLRHIIAIKKLNNIMINCLRNLRASILPEK